MNLKSIEILIYRRLHTLRILSGIDIPLHPFGGSPIICNDWYSNLPAEIQVRFLSLVPTNQQYENWWSMQDVRFLSVNKTRDVETYSLYIEQLKLEIAKHVQDFAPDIIHCQHLNFGFSRAIAELGLDIPKVGICHGTDVQIATQSKFFLNNMKEIRQNMDLLLFPTHNMASDYFNIDQCEHQYIVVPHGIPDTAYTGRENRRREHSSGKSLLKVVYAGRLTSIKGADIAVSAMKFVSDNVHLTIIGDEDEYGYKAKLAHEVQLHNLQAKVNFEDQIRRNDLWERFLDFDVAVFPSRRLEAFSLTTIEAQARGVVVVYANAGGITNTVGDTGILLTENSPLTLALALESLRRDKKLLTEYREKGYTNAERFRLSQVRLKFFEVSSDLILRITK